MSHRSLVSRVAVFAIGCSLLSADIYAQSPIPPEDPDTPELVLRGREVDRLEYLRGRAEQIGMMRGLHAGEEMDPAWRSQALGEFEQSLAAQTARGGVPSWQPLGPAPIPNGQVVGPVATPVSGRTIAIAIHPTNPDIVFVGTASGGLYRSLNGGQNWTPLTDGAESLSIGAVTFAPSDPSIVYIGTGEHNFSLDSFFGVGVYRLENATSATPTLIGPFSQTSGGSNALAGRGISRILVHPTDPDTIFVATTSAVSGIGAVPFPAFPSRGIYRSVNATGADPRFDKLTDLLANANVSVRDIAFDPEDPNRLIANPIAGGANQGGIYLSTNALAAQPTFTQTEIFSSSSTSELTAEFATYRDPLAAFPVFYAAVGNGGGRVLISTDGGASWTQQIDNNFCTPQCFYDIAVAVDPTDPTTVYLGGSPNLVFATSTNSGLSFTQSANGLHVDSHVIEVAPSDPTVLYFGSDGGIYRSDDSGQNWTPLNNSEFSATQFQGIATHPIDYQVVLGGTQDNGTNLLQPAGTWLRVDFGDGGFTGIDQNAVNTTSVRVYHTYFNATSLQGYGTTQANLNGNFNWTFRGCQSGGSTVNGINCTGSILFYAPLVLGPGDPNTVYYGSDRLYRSADTGINHTVVSQNPLKSGIAISAIAIGPADDNIRIVGLRDGSLFRTLTGSSSLDVADAFGPGGTIPDTYIGRIAIDPSNANNVYVALAGYIGPGLNLWRSSNFLSATPTWAPAANGIPNTPISSMTIDPEQPQHIYAGTDIGVYRSTDGGANWAPYGSGLPRVPVFGLAFAGPQNPSGRGPLRAATHGRGIWEIVSQPASLSINDVSIVEGNSGSSNLQFTITRSNNNDAVSFEVGTADGSATAGSDYSAVFEPVVMAANGSLTTTIDVPISGDTVLEPDENFTLMLANASGATIADDTGVGTISNDDSASIAINDVTLAEGNSGNTAFVFTVSLSGAVQDGFSVPFSTSNGSATQPGDYANTSATLNFAGSAGETQTITVQVVGDTVLEPNESFNVTLGAPSNAAVSVSDDTGVGTINNDDSASIAINDVTLAEGNSGNSAFVFTVSLTGSVQGGFSVPFATSNGSATQPDDYASASGTLNFAGSSNETQTITVQVVGDTVLEPNESFNVVLGAPSNAAVSVSDDTGVGTINNDDSASIAINDVSLAEGNSGNSAFVFTVSLTGAVQGGFSVPFSTSNGSATQPSDYGSTSGTLNFAGSASETQTITVQVVGDTVVESNETFSVVLGSPDNAAVSVSDDTGVGTINNDDSASIAINDVTLAEGNSGTTAFVFTVSLTGAVQDGFSVPFSSADGSATQPSDYASTSGTLNFAGSAGETQTITVQVVGDTIAEPDETFTVNLGSTGNASVSVSDNSGLGTINNDDNAADIAVSIDDGRSTIPVGQSTVYVVTVSNLSNVIDATAVDIAQTAPPALENLSWTCTGSGGASCPASGSGALNLTVALPADSSVEFQVTATVAIATQPASTLETSVSATLQPPQSDPNSANNVATDANQVLGDPLLEDGFETP